MDNELCEVPKNYQRKYYSLKNNNNKEMVSDSVHDKTVTETHHKWSSNTPLIISESIIADIDAKRICKNGKIKLRSFPGAIRTDLNDYIKPLLKKAPDTIIEGTNDAVSHTLQK